ncbi:MAG: major facilitator superfamily permease [Clostridia bacterium]|nr:major facilitator superfamily permease [Clostridia bacterium]
MEKSWALYDWANSAYSMTVTSTILPLYFKMVYENGGGAATMSTAYWGYTNAIATLFVALLAPILGTIADYRGFKKKFFTAFVCLGVMFTALLAIVPSTYWLMLLVFYVITVMGFSGSNIFYDSFLIDATKEERMDRVSTMGYAMGYIGSTIPFIICMALVIMAQFEVIPLTIEAACKIAFVITAIWWGVFSLPMLKNVHQVYGINVEPKPILNSFKRLASTFKNIRAHKTVFMFLIAYFFYIDGVDTIIKIPLHFYTVSFL